MTVCAPDARDAPEKSFSRRIQQTHWSIRLLDHSRHRLSPTSILQLIWATVATAVGCIDPVVRTGGVHYHLVSWNWEDTESSPSTRFLPSSLWKGLWTWLWKRSAEQTLTQTPDRKSSPCPLSWHSWWSSPVRWLAPRQWGSLSTRQCRVMSAKGNGGKRKVITLWRLWRVSLKKW